MISGGAGTWAYVGSESASYTKAEADALLNQKQDKISDLETIRSGAALGATAVQPEEGKGLFSGSYNDLTDKPTIPPAVTDDHINSLIDAKLGDLETAVTMLEGVV